MTFVNARLQPIRSRDGCKTRRGTDVTDGNLIYLGLVVGGMAIFAVFLAYASWIAPGDKHF